MVRSAELPWNTRFHRVDIDPYLDCNGLLPAGSTQFLLRKAALIVERPAVGDVCLGPSVLCFGSMKCRLAGS